MPDDFKPNEKSMRDILYVLFRHKWKIVPIFVLASIVTIILVVSKPDMYESNAKILVSGGRGNPLEIVTGMQGPSEVSAESALLTSRGFAEVVVDRVGPEKILFIQKEEKRTAHVLSKILRKTGLPRRSKKVPDSVTLREHAIKAYIETLELILTPRSSLIDITYHARSPELAQEILKKLTGVTPDKTKVPSPWHVR